MHNFSLSNLNPNFRIKGSETQISAEIIKVTLQQPITEKALLMEVSDENGMLLYQKTLIPLLPEVESDQNEYPEIPVNKRFIFSNFIDVQIISKEKEAFAVQLTWI